MCCLVLCCALLSCPVLSCPVLSCPVPSCPVLSFPVLSCPVLSCPVLSCPVLSCPVLSCLVLSCLVFPRPILSFPALVCAPSREKTYDDVVGPIYIPDGKPHRQQLKQTSDHCKYGVDIQTRLMMIIYHAHLFVFLHLLMMNVCAGWRNPFTPDALCSPDSSSLSAPLFPVRPPYSFTSRR